MTAKEVRKVFIYDGINLLWRKSPRYGIDSNTVAGHKNTYGYREVKYKRQPYFAHRLIWLYVHGRWPSDHVDHIDHNPANNRIENLRETRHCENLKNQKLRSTNTSGYGGVRLLKSGKYAVRILNNFEEIHLGHFDTIEEAISMRLTANDHYGYHDNHGVKL